MKQFKGKAIYNPNGKAGEYSYWACNFYTGCSNNCDYCYCKRGVMSAVWSDTPQLKKCFGSEFDARSYFIYELDKNIDEIRKHGIFFSFTTDPMLPETMGLTIVATGICQSNHVPVKILTKRGIKEADHFCYMAKKRHWNESIIAYGFTLTGHDEMEPNASSNLERIEAMRKLHEAKFKTFASIEPIIDLNSSLNMIIRSAEYCDLFKIGLMSGKKEDKNDLMTFCNTVLSMSEAYHFKVYFKESITKLIGAIVHKNCVGRDFNLFRQ